MSVNYRKKEIIKESDRPSERQMEAEIYLKEYDIQNILTEMINYLLHKRSKNPIIEMIKYLGGLLTEKEREQEKIIIPPPEIDYHPLIDFPNFNKECNSLLKEYLDMNIFMSLKDNISKYGMNLGNVMRVNEVYPKNNIGVMIGDADCLNKFRDLFLPIICKVHNLNKDELKYFTENNFNLKNLKFDDIKKINLDDIKGLNKISFSISRNLSDEPFVCCLNVENRTENILKKLDDELKNKKIYKYGELNEFENNKFKINESLDDINFDFDFWNAVNLKDNLVQKNRKIYYNKDRGLMMLINYCDNFQFIKSMIISEDKEKKDEIKTSTNEIFIKNFNEFNDFIRKIEYYFAFEFEHNFGYLTSNISLFGTGFNIKTEINLDKLIGTEVDLDKINKILNGFDKYSDNFHFKKNSDDENILIFSSSPKICYNSISEFLVEYFEKILKIKNGN